jgi:hypothetical protein
MTKQKKSAHDEVAMDVEIQVTEEDIAEGLRLRLTG